jgi:dCMP deaminase
MKRSQKVYDKLYLDVAERFAQMSYATRSKVGGVLVKDNNIISFGWNGTPAGFDNRCENDENATLPIVVHCEENIFAKLARKGCISAEGSTIYLTLSPCFNCSKLIIQSGVKRVVYLEEYRDKAPIEFLKRAKIKCILFK